MKSETKEKLNEEVDTETLQARIIVLEEENKSLTKRLQEVANDLAIRLNLINSYLSHKKI